MYAHIYIHIAYIGPTPIHSSVVIGLTLYSAV